MNTPLAGIRVLDLSRILAGPWAGQLLADLGAQVIKVERPGAGDDTRQWGPPYLKDEHGNDTQEAAYYLAANRGKQSITVDITKPEGQSLLQDLAKDVDVVIENYKVGGLKKYGLDYPALAAINPRLVYCSITGFGQTGPYRDRAGYDFMIQGMGGLMSITGERDGQAGAGPQKVGVAVTDIFTGLYATIAIQGALLERVRSGQGQYIDLALFDVQAAVLANQATNYLVGGITPTRMGNAHPNIVPYQAFATADGYIILAIGNDLQFRKFCAVAQVPNLADDPKFSTNPARVANREQVCATVADLLKQHTSEHWLAELEAKQVPCGPINNIEQVFNDPQLLARNMRIQVAHPQAGTVELAGNPIHYGRSELQQSVAPPSLGADTDQVLREQLGLSSEAVAALRTKGVID
ncbi:CaiB/BaiF CoA transferase family protein [Simiduia aestuariiviva]|uniref:Crotonobetainyl-CoA:carnitine CoA-transferase CaiB-like acyl-CoA transferase n=1 Tax=Simiduia aestuariiviva TaxID=1510459 RepID=A0A839UVB1_9GAMM|nr:CaiB/BaiF CoA-transferase family protein [Simiduia aestuariiviva]MBB3169408.1 crotonobetainyl-CoA:carnitine CoA-transferase CaiB-like acyl-CoA transferase [Simiduia aestuariiviva]